LKPLNQKFKEKKKLHLLNKPILKLLVKKMLLPLKVKKLPLKDKKLSLIKKEKKKPNP